MAILCLICGVCIRGDGFDDVLARTEVLWCSCDLRGEAVKLNMPRGGPDDRGNLLRQKGARGFSGGAFLYVVIAGLIFAVGLGVRLYDLEDPPLDFHPTRQMHSALIARGMYYEDAEAASRLGNVTPEQRQIAITQWRVEGMIEPQVLERLVAWTYRAAGGPFLWIARLYSILFWMAGAVVLFVLAVEWFGYGGALVGAFFFLIWPYAVVASRAFQPDPLMVALIVAALWAGSRWERCRQKSARTGWGWALAAGLLGGLAIYIKSVAVFFVAPALAGLVLAEANTRTEAGFRRGLRWLEIFTRLVRDRQVWVMAALAVTPYLVYHIDGVYIHGFLVEQFSLRFFPEMWRDPAFYLRWVSNLGRAIPFELCLAALVGGLLTPGKANRAALLGLWVGYVVCGMTLPHHISTHDYYHLALFAPVSLGLAALAQVTFANLRGPAWLARGMFAGALLAALVMGGYQARNILKRSDYSIQARAWEAAGRRLGAGAGVVVLSNDYGTGMAYWGWTAPVNWPSADDLRFRAESGSGLPDGQGLSEEETFATRFEQLAVGRSFFVISPLEELERQPDLKQYLAEHYRVLQMGEEAGPDLMIYDLRGEPFD